MQQALRHQEMGLRAAWVHRHQVLCSPGLAVPFIPKLPQTSTPLLLYHNLISTTTALFFKVKLIHQRSNYLPA